MAHRNVIRTPLSAETQRPATASASRAIDVNPTGYLCDNWVSLKTPALRINPEATPGELAAWCWAEACNMESCGHLLSQAMTHKNIELTADEFDRVILHRLRPLREVLEHLTDTLDKQQQAGSGAV